MSRPDSPRRIVLVWIGRLGDLIVTEPFFRSMRVAHPEAHITLVTGDRGTGAASLIEHVDEVLVLHKAHRPIHNIGLIRKLRADSADLLVDLNPSPSRASTLVCRLAKAGHKVAFGRGKPDAVFDELLDPAGVEEHMLDRYARAAAFLGLSYDPPPKITPPKIGTERALNAVASLPGEGPLVLLHAGNFKKTDNRWPEDRFAALTDRLVERGGLRVAHLAGPGEEDAVAGVISLMRHPVPVLGPFPIDVSTSLFQTADLVIANATGTAHLAAAVGTKTVTFLGRYTKTVWMPKSGHEQVVSDSWESCRSIGLDDAWEAVERSLG